MFHNTFSIDHSISKVVVGTAKDGQSKGMMGFIVDVGMDNDEEQQMPPMIDTELDLKATLVVVPANLILQWREQLTICVCSQSSCQAKLFALQAVCMKGKFYLAWLDHTAGLRCTQYSTAVKKEDPFAYMMIALWFTLISIKSISLCW